MNIQDIDIKHRVPLKGKYNRAICDCPFCDADIFGAENMIGFAEWRNAVAVIFECPECFEYSYFHASKVHYDAFKRKNLTQN